MKLATNHRMLFFVGRSAWIQVLFVVGVLSVSSCFILPSEDSTSTDSSGGGSTPASRACHQFSQMTAATQWIAPRKAQARLS